MIKEYIEREAVKRELLSWAVCMNHPEYLMRDDALHVIDSIPAADVVEVVRCKDCKFFLQYSKVEHTAGSCFIKMAYSDSMHYCACQPDDYCSYGERSKEND